MNVRARVVDAVFFLLEGACSLYDLVSQLRRPRRTVREMLEDQPLPIPIPLTRRRTTIRPPPP